VIINKFDPNPILVNINKLKPYRFVEDHTFQPILVKPSDFLLEESMEATHFDNLFNEELVATNHFGNLFVEESVQLNTKGLTTNNLIERKIDNNLSNLELVETSIIDLLKRKLVGNLLVSPNSVQSNDVSINLIIGVNFLRKICPKSCNFLQV
jgi:hypothetical protein